MNIVDRCRGWHKPSEIITGDVQLYLDAANEIERLRADNERLEELVKLEQSSQYAENKKLRAEIERLRAELDEVYEANGKLAYLASQNDRLRAENDDLKAALDVWNSSELGVMIAKLRAALLPYAERAIESEDGGKIARAALNEETK